MDTLIMTPEPGERLVRFAGDRLVFSLQPKKGDSSNRAFLRTNLGRGARLRHEIIHAHTGKLGLATSSWRDIPMTWNGDRWQVDLALPEEGFFKAKAYMVDSENRQHWPSGEDFGVTVHPDQYRTANTVYCAFTRMFGPTRMAFKTENPAKDSALSSLDKEGYTVIPPSGTFRDLIEQLPHIIHTLGCRILHLLPVNPVPTTYARFGRFGSPYACQDLLAIDPALVVFDKKTTGIDQFRELTYATHLKGGRVFLDVVINHTGWGSSLQENHPEWFVRDKKGNFVSPGAWGVVWEDLTEMHHENPALWEYMGDVFLEWCRRGVDGFRCDAGYMIPVPAWQYITARVLEEFPETVFLLEGLGGSWEATESLLTIGGMQWAYSELFQNYTGKDVAWYFDYCLKQSERVGLYVHYSETHDNDRLAKKGREWSLLRNRLCALASVSGGFGFTCGVEWLAQEKINVHQSRGLSWENPENILPELAQLNRLICDHPCFFDNACLTRLSENESHVLALSRVSAEGKDQILILVNTDIEKSQQCSLPTAAYGTLNKPSLDLLTSKPFLNSRSDGQSMVFTLKPGECRCLASSETPLGLSGQAYRQTRARSAWALKAISRIWANEEIGPYDWKKLAEIASRNPSTFLAAISRLDVQTAALDPVAALESAIASHPYPNVVSWQAMDARRITPVPPNHWLLIQEPAPFRLRLESQSAPEKPATHLQSTDFGKVHLAFVPPDTTPGDRTLHLDRFNSNPRSLEATVRFLGANPIIDSLASSSSAVAQGLERPRPEGLVLLTNDRGGMARIQVDLGQVQSKYDAVLAANLHPSVPVDRHILVKSVRVWALANGFITPLSGRNLIGFTPGPPCEWKFVVSAGDGCSAEIHLVADMLPHQNTVVLRFLRPTHSPAFGTELPESAQVSLIVRPDILDRNFHHESKRDPSAEHHYNTHVKSLAAPEPGFEFTPAPDRRLVVSCDSGEFHPEPEWNQDQEHPIERSRGQIDREDAYSPGWFQLPLRPGHKSDLVFQAGSSKVDRAKLKSFPEDRLKQNQAAIAKSGIPDTDPFGQRLALAVQSFVVKRDDTCTVIAGYPWFLDWGRDSLICARGLLAAGLQDHVRQLLIAFGRFAQDGTLPNSIHGEDASNRDTSDAPLWYGVVAEELAEVMGDSVYDTKVDPKGRSIADVLLEIATGYHNGTPNGIRMDQDSGLIWSPSHFTWMDTNHPAGTPREGYPIEIQALWIRLCRQMGRLAKSGRIGDSEDWNGCANRAEASVNERFWLEDRGYPADLLKAPPHTSARDAEVDDALRSNCLLLVSLGLLTGTKARRCVDAAIRHLVIPGALRSLAPLEVSLPLPIHGRDGGLLNDPKHPYWGRYEGDEDTRRKPAYHNGTAWTWPFPVFCEALAAAWDQEPQALAAARAYLGSMDQLLTEGCLGHIPEVLDGDAPHQQRGCDAQAWGATEALRVWKRLNQTP